jgi:transcriptional regulator with XRE-family HTH domain
MNERLIKLMEYLEYTPSVFADEIGVIRSSISHIMSGRNKPGVELLQRVLKRFPEVSAEWLLAGIGPMFKEGARTIVNPATQHEIAHTAHTAQKSAEQTSLLGYIESIQQPADITKMQDPRPVEHTEPVKTNGTSQTKTPLTSVRETKVPEQPQAEAREVAIEMPATLKKEKTITRILVYFSDKTYQEFIAGED